MSLEKFSQDELLEMSFIEIAYELLSEKKASVTFDEMLAVVAEKLEYTKEQIDQKVSQFYTDLNTDGRFTFRGDGWGLRAWYQVEHVDDAPITDIRMKKKKAKKIADDDFEGFDIEDEDDDFAEEIEELEDLDDDLADEEDVTPDLLDAALEDDTEDFDLDIVETTELEELDEDLGEDLDDEEIDIEDEDDTLL